MIVKDKDNREIEISVCGRYDDDIEISDAYYLDSDNEEVSDETIDYIMDAYSDDIYQEWYENQVCAAEYLADSLMDR